MARHGNSHRTRLPYFGGDVPAGYELKRNSTLKTSRRNAKRAAEFGAAPLPVDEYRRVHLPYAGGDIPAGFELKRNRTMKTSRRAMKRAAKYGSAVPAPIPRLPIGLGIGMLAIAGIGLWALMRPKKVTYNTVNTL